jgi:hypothetical protein
MASKYEQFDQYDGDRHLSKPECFGYFDERQNAKQFNLRDRAFFTSYLGNGTDIMQGIVYGMRLGGVDPENPRLVYDMAVVDSKKSTRDKPEIIEGVDPSALFSTLDEAEASALKQLQFKCELQREYIEAFFKAAREK